MKNLSLVVLAAGMGSRYGSLKQMDAFGPNGETIMDYSIYDAKRAGFNHVVFIIREHFEEAFREKFENKFGEDIKVDFVTQELHKGLGNYKLPDDREKPWGTGHALMMVSEVVDGPFAVINADDYYGVEAYQILADYLKENEDTFCIVAYDLKNTLSEHGTVNRGVCNIDENDHLKDIQETLKISKSMDVISYPKDGDNIGTLEPDTKVSMNMFGLNPKYFDLAEEQFGEFLKNFGHEQKSEFYIPQILDREIKADKLQVEVLTSPSKWFGVTYKDDKPFVQENIKRLIEEGIYPEQLWS